MEVTCSFLRGHLQTHYKKLLVICTATATVYLVKKYMENKRKPKGKKEKKKIREFPTVDQIQKFIENLPFEAVRTGKAITLKDLLGELSEFSEDEDWKELIASVHTMYQDPEQNEQDKCEDTVSIMSIYEDPNALNMGGEETTDVEVAPTTEELKLDLVNGNQGKGDVELKREKEEELLENLLLGKQGEGDKESKELK
ncbi:uncharacterized protein LOC126746861 [Anthonomus grandis grandis]|uniref:uncharacterized protein LOC126746861 n=1 Tax=Anthonomus grandis grandis TaxID=2921223 RepID=UPI002166B006|nr:uncharacterized protein LOC126746861 [Anthonomus grandis grandis]